MNSLLKSWHQPKPKECPGANAWLNPKVLTVKRLFRESLKKPVKVTVSIQNLVTIGKCDADRESNLSDKPDPLK